MRWSSAYSTASSAARALAEASTRARAALGGVEPNVAFVFFTGYAPDETDRVAALIPSETGAAAAIGAVGAGVVGGGREIERAPATSVVFGTPPPDSFRTFHLPAASIPDADAGPSAWTSRVDLDRDATSGFVLFGDATSDAASAVVAGLDYAYPSAPKIGGLFGGGATAGLAKFFCDGRAAKDGVVGVAFDARVAFEAIVAKGARPFGSTGVVTRADRRFVRDVDRLPAFDFVRSQLATLDLDDQRRPLGAVCVGIDSDPFRDVETPDDEFLVRDFLGADEASGAVAVSDELHAGRRIRMHLRDAAAGAADLRARLRARSVGAARPDVALMFSCRARGAAFFGESGHDSRVFRELIGDVPIGGVFCSGEIGPVGGRTHLHGYSTCFACLREA
jgi:small ligand-binding sensory domain FIST